MSKPDLIYGCPKCKYIPKKSNNSTELWLRYDEKICPECGTQLQIMFSQDTEMEIEELSEGKS